MARNSPSRALAVLFALLLAVFGVQLVLSGAASADDGACVLSVPGDPLSATGLATPYQLRGCDEVVAGAFVEAAVLSPGGQLSIYHPLVVNAGDDPAQDPVVPVVPAGSTVGVWFGFNGDTLTFTGPGARSVVGGLGRNDPFGQFGYINAPSLFRAANAAIAAGTLVVPPLGTIDGTDEPCPTTRSFAVVDQDQSDNLATAYWVTGEGLMSQIPLPGASKLSNGSDEGLLAYTIDPALGCSPWLLPSLDGLGDVPSLAANELQAAAMAPAPVALVPTSDPMVLHRGRFNPAKTNAYRAGVNMGRINLRTETPAAYCANLRNVAPAFLARHAGLLGPALVDRLTTRLVGSLDLLGCNNPAGKPGNGHKGRMDGMQDHGPGNHVTIPRASAHRFSPRPVAAHRLAGLFHRHR